MTRATESLMTLSTLSLTRTYMESTYRRMCSSIWNQLSLTISVMALQAAHPSQTTDNQEGGHGQQPRQGSLHHWQGDHQHGAGQNQPYNFRVEQHHSRGRSPDKFDKFDLRYAERTFVRRYVGEGTKESSPRPERTWPPWRRTTRKKSTAA